MTTVRRCNQNLLLCGLIARGLVTCLLPEGIQENLRLKQITQ